MNRFRPKQMYIRIFLLLSTIFAAAMIPFSIFLWHQFSKYAVVEVNKFTEDKLDLTLQNTEFMLRKLKSYGMSIYEDQNIQNWLVSDVNDPMLQTAAIQSMTNLLSTEEFIHKTYMIKMKTREVIDSRVGLRYFDQFQDVGMLDMVNFNRPKFLQYFNHAIGDEHFLSLILPSTPSRTDHYGYVVMLLDNKLLKQVLLQSNEEIGIEVVILDQQGNMVLGPSNPNFSFADLLSFKTKTAGSLNTEIDGEEWTIQYADMKSQPWTIYYLSKLGHMQNNILAFQRKIIVSSSILLVVLIVIIFWSSRRSYLPFSQLAAQIKSKHLDQIAPDNSRNEEYKVIKQGIELLVDNLDKMNHSIRNHQELIDGEYLQQWILHGNMNEPIKEYIQAKFDLLCFTYLHLLVIRIDSYSSFTEKYNFGSRKLMKYAIGNIAEEIIDNRKWTAESVDFGGDHIVLLVGRNETDAEELVQTLHEITDQIEKWLELQVVIGTSKHRHMYDDIRFVYDNIYELTLLKFISGRGKVFEENEYEKYLASVEPLQDESILENLIHTVRLGHSDRVKSLLDLLFDQMQSVSYAECKFQLTLIIYSIMKAFKQMSFFKTVDGIQNFLERFDTLGDARDWLYMELSEISDNIGRYKSSSRKDELVTEIVEYVKNRIHDPMLTVEEISDHLSLSVSYTRQMFREVYDMTLSDFILSERIFNVQRLLETTNWSITDISERSGFQTKSHFYTAFKKATGMTPSEYRQTNRGR